MRTGAAPDERMLALGASVNEDAAIVQLDVAGSIAHVMGLARAELVTDEQALQLIGGLQDIARAHDQGLWDLDAQLEDVHMNVEHALKGAVGDVADLLHTGRSRNDQVALDLVLKLRLDVSGLALTALDISERLADEAAGHLDTPWTARTHGQPAQPATIGFLLAAHAIRFQDQAQRALGWLERATESPLGSGAVAGSTLPLDPAFTAGLLGLEPPRNALLATSSRDLAIEAAQVAAGLALAASTLSSDLIALIIDGAAHLAPEHTTGSSLMPHKRNPDGLELIRGEAALLQHVPVAMASTVAGLGLGYHRDLQPVKREALGATARTGSLLELLDAIVDAMTFTPSDGEPPVGVTATDLAEALVAKGVPFRQAYARVAKAMHDIEQGVDQDAAFEALGPDVAALLHPDASRRDTAGGPAPHRVQDTLQALATRSHALAGTLHAAAENAERPLVLLGAHPSDLITTVEAA